MNRTELINGITRVLTKLTDEKLAEAYDKIMVIYIKDLTKNITREQLDELMKKQQEGPVAVGGELDYGMYRNLYDENGMLRSYLIKENKENDHNGVEIFDDINIIKKYNKV